MGFNLNYILNKVLPVSTLGLKQNIVSRTGELIASKEEIVLDIKEPVVIDYAEFVTDSRDKGLLRVQQYNGGNLESLRLMTYAGTLTGFSPINVNTNASSLVRLDIYDTTNDRYKLSMQSVSFPEGVKISVINNSPDLEMVCASFIRYRSF